MRRLLFIAAGAALVGAGFAGALEGCGGGDDASTTGPGNDGGGGDSTIGSDDGGGEGGSVGEGGSTTDGGGGGPVSNPGEATCGSLSCDIDAGNGGGPAGKPYCCERADGGDSCETNNTACGVTGTRLECDEPADCPKNNHSCCLQTNIFPPGPGDAGVTVGTAQCNNDCNKNDLTLCKTAADCGDAGTCALRTCRGGDTFYACNTNDDCK